VILFDSSALLAFLHGEPGADEVEDGLVRGPSAVSAANWSEVAQKVLVRGRDWPTARALLRDYDLAVEPVTTADAELAARLWQPGRGLSLGDRLCLATAERLDADVWTADAAWGRDTRIRQIR
jgi:ribonuclease VapC